MSAPAAPADGLRPARTGDANYLLAVARRRPTMAAGLAILAAMAFVALLSPLLGTVDPLALDTARRLLPPSPENWFGTDHLGRDLYSRVIYGARISLIVGVLVAVIAAFIGIAIGVVCGFIRWLDPLAMRVLDAVMSIPAVLLAVALMALTEPSTRNVIIAISFAEIPRVARLVRSLVLSLREQAFVDAAIVAGSSTAKIIARHILPNTMGPVIVQASYICASAMIIEAMLSFIGAGTPPSIPSWGSMMAEGRALWQVKPHAILFPAIFLSLTVLAVNLLGDGIRDELDPRSTKRV